MTSVLVIEDDCDVRELTCDVLEHEGLSVSAVGDGRAAIRYLESSPAPSVIVLDLMMPGVSGWDVLAYLARAPRLAAIPVIVTTATDADETDVPHAQVVLQKPHRFLQLPALVHALEARRGPLHPRIA